MRLPPAVTTHDLYKRDLDGRKAKTKKWLPTAKEYHTNMVLGRRQDITYKFKKGMMAKRHKRKYKDVYQPLKCGPVPTAVSYTRFGSDLAGAPELPASHLRMFDRISLGRARECPPAYKNYYHGIFRSMAGH